jgi:hypothetical protein
MNKSGTAGKTTKKARNPASWVVPMGAVHLVVPAIKQALSMLGQAREALIFAQCPTARCQGPTGYPVGTERTSYRQAARAGRKFRPEGVFSMSRGGRSMTLQEAKSIARHLRLTLRKVRSGDYRVNFRDGNETTAYYTNDLEDAVNAAVEMARKRELSAWPKPDPHCRQSSC